MKLISVVNKDKITLAMTEPIPESISEFILASVDSHSSGLTALVAATFEISRQAALKRINVLVEEGVLSAEGNTRQRRYKLRNYKTEKVYELSNRLEEHVIWTEFCVPEMKAIPENLVQVCEYGFTEMVNNAIDHSEGKSLYIALVRNALSISFDIWDDGIGIFRKISRALNLADEREAILELAKGKLTTDPARHSGEGIFFTTRMFDEFSMLSHHLFFSHELSEVDDGDWLIESRDADRKGTYVTMKIATRSKATAKDVFDRYSSGDSYTFSRTHVPVSLAQYGDTNLISRSQAKRVLARFERFSEVFLNFKDVGSVGQAFADEIFRVFAKSHPNTKIIWIHANPQVEQMIRRAQAAIDSNQQTLFPE